MDEQKVIDWFNLDGAGTGLVVELIGSAVEAIIIIGVIEGLRRYRNRRAKKPIIRRLAYRVAYRLLFLKVYIAWSKAPESKEFREFLHYKDLVHLLAPLAAETRMDTASWIESLIRENVDFLTTKQMDVLNAIGDGDPSENVDELLSQLGRTFGLGVPQRTNASLVRSLGEWGLNPSAIQEINGIPTFLENLRTSEKLSDLVNEVLELHKEWHPQKYHVPDGIPGSRIGEIWEKQREEAKGAD